MRRLRLVHAPLGIALAGFALVGLVSAACGDDSSSSATPTKAVSTAAAAPTSAPAQATTAPASATSGASAALIKVAATSKANALTDNAGMSLYTFDNDKTAGSSSCNGGCATTWPPVVTTAAAAPSGVTGASGAFSLIARDDGAKQVAYNGKPLYRYAPDKAPGDTSGDGVGNVWHLAKP